MLRHLHPPDVWWEPEKLIILRKVWSRNRCILNEYWWFWVKIGVFSVKRIIYFKLQCSNEFTLTNLASRESPKAGNCSSYRWTACWALTASTHKWQSAARKKYSLALYLINELSKAEPATWKFDKMRLWRHINGNYIQN